jgi:hypothetical protein
MPSWLIWILVALAAIAVLFALDRLLLAAERRGWIYYRKKKPNPASVGSALMQVQALFEPPKQHVVDVRRQQVKRQQDGDQGPDDGSEPGDPQGG